MEELVKGCGKSFTVWKHVESLGGCGARVGVVEKCHNKWCDVCWDVWTRVGAARLESAISTFRQPKHLVLTSRNVPYGKLSSGWRQIDAAFSALRRSKLWRSKVARKGRAWVASRGLTVNMKSRTWHHHLHVVIDSGYIPHQLLKAEWTKATKGEAGVAGLQINAGRARKGLTNELVKNMGDVVRCARGLSQELVHGTHDDRGTLIAKLERDPERFAELVSAMAGRRWFSGGVGIIPPEEEWMDDGVKCRCPGCGSPFAWHEWDRGWMPAKEWNSYTLTSPWWRDCHEGWATGPPDS